MTTRKTIPEISVDARMLHQHLATIKIGEIVTWEAMSNIIGRPVSPGNSGYSALMTARNRAQNDEGFVFDAVARVGLKRLADVDIVNGGQAAIDKMRRAARRGVKRLLSVNNFADLPNDAKIKHNTYASLLGAVVHMSQDARVKKLEAHVGNTQAALPLAKTLEIFKS